MKITDVTSICLPTRGLLTSQKVRPCLKRFNPFKSFTRIWEEELLTQLSNWWRLIDEIAISGSPISDRTINVSVFFAELNCDGYRLIKPKLGHAVTLYLPRFTPPVRLRGLSSREAANITRAMLGRYSDMVHTFTCRILWAYEHDIMAMWMQNECHNLCDRANQSVELLSWKHTA